MTAYRQLEKKEEKNRFLIALNTTVHHEMIAPLKANSEASRFLFENLEDSRQSKVAQTIYISSQLLLHHAHDLLDQRNIDKEGFVPVYTKGSVILTIMEIIDMVSHTIT